MSHNPFDAIIKITEGAWTGSYVYHSNPLLLTSGQDSALHFSSPTEARQMQDRIHRTYPDIKHAEIILL